MNSEEEKMQTESEYRKISLGLIDRDPTQPRKNFRQNSLEKLAASLREGGLLQPITIKANPHSSGRFLVVMGERRMRAAEIAGWREIPCFVQATDRDTWDASFEENFHREDLDLIDQANAFCEALYERGWDVDRLVKKTGLSATTIRNRIRLRLLPEEIQTMIRDGSINLTAAMNLAQYHNKRRAISVARKLIRGEDVPEVTDAQMSDLTSDEQRADRIAAKLPQSESKVLKRISDFSSREPSFVGVVVATLPEADKDKMRRSWNRRSKASKERIIERLESLSHLCREAAGYLQNLDKPTKAAEPAPRRSSPLSRPKPASPLPPPSPDPKPTLPTPEDALLGNRVLFALFSASPQTLNRKVLAKRLGSKPATVEGVVHLGLRAAIQSLPFRTPKANYHRNQQALISRCCGICQKFGIRRATELITVLNKFKQTPDDVDLHGLVK